MEMEVCSWRRSEADGGRGILLVDEQYVTTQVPLLENLKYHGSQYQIDNVARGEMTTRSHVYKKKTQSIFKAPIETEFLEYFGAGSGSWILEIQN